MIDAVFLIIAAQGHVFDNFNDPQLCDVIARNMTQVPPATYPIESMSMQADCQSKRIRAAIETDLDGAAFDAYIERFVTTARSGVCDRSNPTMRAFADRGWGFTYTFEASDGTTVTRALNC